MGFGLGIMGLGLIIPLLLIGLVIYAIAKLLQGGSRSYRNNNERNDALDILNQRYARGEVSDEEYQRKKETLRGR